MRYAYYPGCSLESTAKAYDLSLRAVFRLLGQELEEIDDWNCCGATAYMSVAETVALAVSARNLALAERMGGLDVVAPCSACFTVLNKTQRYLRADADLRERVQASLGEAGLTLTRPVRVRHPLDVLVNDVGLDAVVARAARQPRRGQGGAVLRLPDRAAGARLRRPRGPRCGWTCCSSGSARRWWTTRPRSAAAAGCR